MDPQPEVTLKCGRVRGRHENGIAVFRGIRYGASTEGKNRFCPPVPAESWDGVFEADAYGPHCPQPDLGLIASSPLSALFGSVNGEASEDCLRLNIYSPSIDNRKRPVMFWIHGGYYTFGSGNEALYDGSAMASLGDVVVVTVTHRLNLFGYLFLDGAESEYFGQKPNVGQLDLVLALQWVRDNIEKFGGDPEQVTLFGESGGGRKCALLMAMPAAKRLFKRAIIQSGPCTRVVTAEYGRQLADALLAELGIARVNLSQLQDIPVSRLLEAHSVVAQSTLGQSRQPGFIYGGFSPVLDGEVVPSHPFDEVASPLSDDVSILIGTNRDEQALFLLLDLEYRSGLLNEEKLLARLKVIAGDRAADILSIYRHHEPDASAADLLVSIETDRTYWYHSVKLADAKAAQSAPVFMYRFDWPSPALGGKLNACHGVEIPFVFGNLQVGAGLVGESSEAEDISRSVSQTWMSFAETGKPGCSAIPDWSSYTIPQRKTMLIDVNWQLLDDPKGWARKLWESIESSQ